MVTNFFKDQQAFKQQHLENAVLKSQQQQEHGYENSSCFFFQVSLENDYSCQKTHGHGKLIMLLGE